MEVQLNKKYPLAVSADRAWAVLTDIRAVASCMPGAQITEQIDATHYKGQVRSKVGPAVMSFAGDIDVLALDVAERRLELLGKGADKGGSSAAMKLVARLEPGADDAACVLLGDATVTVSGKLAQFGGRLLVPIADAMLAQFAQAFEAAAAKAPGEVDARPAVAVAVAHPPAEAELVATSKSTSTATSTSSDVAMPEPVVATPAVAVPLPLPRTALPPAPASPAAPANDLNALGLAWIVIRGWFLGLFGKKTA